MVGDVMYDASLYYAGKAERRSRILDALDAAPGEYVLATVHRAENTDRTGPLRAIFGGLTEVAASLPVILPLHPRTRAALEREGMLDAARRALRITEPVGYLDMVMLEKNAQVIVTDSGGVQKEAFFFRVPCVTVRTETEWVELVEMGWNRLAPPETAAAVAGAVSAAAGQEGAEGEPYGRGNACADIVSALLYAET